MVDRIYGVVILILGFVAAAVIRYSAGTHARRRREARRTYRRLQEIASPGIRFEIMRRMYFRSITTPLICLIMSMISSGV